jgi:hypothetical protein
VVDSLVENKEWRHGLSSKLSFPTSHYKRNDIFMKKIVERTYKKACRKKNDLNGNRKYQVQRVTPKLSYLIDT